MLGCTLKAYRERESLSSQRIKHDVIHESTPISEHVHHTQHNGYCTKAEMITRLRSNLTLCAVICFYLLFPVVGCRGTVTEAHCVFGEVSLFLRTSSINYVIQMM